MIVSVHQPHYLPWAGYFDKIDAADVFVILDTVQFEKNGWQNRNKIKTADGWMWMTVPVNASTDGTIADIQIAGPGKWRKKHRGALVTNYAAAPFCGRYMPFFDDLYAQRWERLADLNVHMLRYFTETLGIGTVLMTASGMPALPDDPNGRLVEIVRHAGGDTYLAGAGSRAYLDTAVFEAAGIRVVFQEYEPVPYCQLFGEFIPGLGVIDALFNKGPETLDVIRGGRRTIL